MSTLCTLGILGLLLLIPNTVNAEQNLANPVVPNATLGPFRHGTFPSLKSRGREWTHAGVDLAAPVGSPVYPFGDGAVTRVITENDSDYSWAGNAVMIEHPTSPRRLYTIYLHLESLLVSPQQNVQGGATKIGSVGHTGAANNVDHVHFEIRYFDDWLPNWSGIRNIYGPGDQRDHPYFKANWEDPLVYFLRFPKGIRKEEKIARDLPRLSSDERSVAVRSEPTKPERRPPQLPSSYGVYVGSSAEFFELRLEKAEDGVANIGGPMALYPRCCTKGPHPKLSEGAIEIVVFLRGLTGVKPVLTEFVYVRQLEKVQVDVLGRPARHGYRESVRPDEWIAAYTVPVRVGPMPNQADMIMVEPRNKLTPGLYGFAIEPSGGPAMRYPEHGQLVFWVGIDPHDKIARCTDWRVKLFGTSGAEPTVSPCSANAVGASRETTSKGLSGRPEDPSLQTRELLGPAPGVELFYSGRLESKVATGMFAKQVRRLEKRVLAEEELDGEKVIKMWTRVKGEFMTLEEYTDYVTVDGRWVARDKGAGRERVTPPVVLLQEPLSSGAQWESSAGRCSLERIEEITIYAGKFNALRRLCDWSGGVQSEEWLSPGLGLIKSITTTREGRLSYELYKIKRPK